MYIGLGIFLIVVGAILTFALNASVDAVNLGMIGWIWAEFLDPDGESSSSSSSSRRLMMTTTATERPFIPAMGKSWLLPLYDPLVWLLRLGPLRHALLREALGAQALHEVLEDDSDLFATSDEAPAQANRDLGKLLGRLPARQRCSASNAYEVA